MTSRRNQSLIAAVGFLLPNLVGFLVFTLFPVALSLWMAFTSWSLKPAVVRQVVGLRNFTDLLGARAVGEGNPALGAGYVFSAFLVCAGVVGALWANFSEWRGVKVVKRSRRKA